MMQKEGHLKGKLEKTVMNLRLALSNGSQTFLSCIFLF